MVLEYGGIFPTVAARLHNCKQTWTHLDEKHDEESRNLIIMTKNIMSGSLRVEVLSSSRYKKWFIEDQVVRILYLE